MGASPLTGDYIWSRVTPEATLRPLRDVRAAFLHQPRWLSVILNKSGGDPYIVAGNGGHNIARLKRSKDSGGRPHSADSSQTDGATRYESPFRAPTVIQEASRGTTLCDWRTMTTRTTAASASS